MGRASLSFILIWAGRKATRGSVGWRWWCVGGGDAGCGASCIAVVGARATGGKRNSLLLFGLLTGKFGDAEHKLEAAQFDAAAMMEKGCAFPACPTASNQTGAAGLTAAQ